MAAPPSPLNGTADIEPLPAWTLTHPDVLLKTCTACRRSLPVDQFHRTSKRGSRGRKSHCHDCHRVYLRDRKTVMIAQRAAHMPAADRICSSCKKTKPLSDFGKKTSSLDGYLRACKPCMRSREQRTATGLRQMVADLKSKNPCADCGRILPSWVMQFDHLDPLTKSFSIGTAAGHSVRGRDRLLDEIAKCEIVCATCHAHRTYCRAKGIEHYPLEGID